ncbi:MAG: hypothetical protein KJS97_10530 [Alphaproteobacteria bacterium]|nr:hypothetical protein [Alphaproteobacteria bacterium]
MRSPAFVVAILFGLALASPADAYTVTPMSGRIAPAGPKSSLRVAVQNTDKDRLDVVFSISAVTADELGRRTFTPAPSDFVIFPPQASVSPGATQTVMIRYVGPPLAKGAIYALRVAQQNVVTYEQTQGDTRIGLKIKQDYLISTIVDPPRSKPSVVFAEPAVPMEGGMTVVIRNDGEAVADISALPWALSMPNGDTPPFNLSMLSFGETQFVAPGGTRRLVVRAPPNATLKLMDSKK